MFGQIGVNGRKVSLRLFRTKMPKFRKLGEDVEEKSVSPPHGRSSLSGPDSVLEFSGEAADFLIPTLGKNRGSFWDQTFIRTTRRQEGYIGPLQQNQQ